MNFSDITSLSIVLLCAYGVIEYILADEKLVNSAFAKWLFAAICFIMLNQLLILLSKEIYVEWFLKLGSMIIVFAAIKYVKNKQLG